MSVGPVHRPSEEEVLADSENGTGRSEKDGYRGDIWECRGMSLSRINTSIK